MPLDDDRTRLRHMVEAAQEAIGYAEGIERDTFDTSRPLQHSVVRCVEIIGEAANRISRDLRSANPQVPRADIIAIRNRIVHAYFDIDIEIVWRTAREDLPALLDDVVAIQERLAREEE